MSKRDNRCQQPGFADDQRGAIMVMGIFMCVLLVGALWYIAGVGDVIIYRERMQEASDAVSFSMAVLMARGMNILVLLNLLMAAIEAIRVAINLIMFATLVLSGINFAIGAALDAASFGTAGTPFILIGEDLFNFEQNGETNLHDRISPLVDDGLEAIHDVEEVVWRMPIAAQAAGVAIANKYVPPLSNGFLGAIGILISDGSTGVPLAEQALPVKWGTTHKLCMKSFDAVKGVLSAIIGGAGSVLISPVEGIANAIGASDFFCELGDKGGAPDMSAQAQQIGQQKCDADQNIQAKCQAAQKDQDTVNTFSPKCPGWMDDPPPTTPAPYPECTTLVATQNTATSEQGQCDSMKQNCTQGVQNSANKNSAQGNGVVKNPNNSSQQASTKNQNQGSSSDKQPSAVDHVNWWNGCDKSQILAAEYSEGKAATYSPKFVNIAAKGKISMADPSLAKGQTVSVSQAEFFYDCAGAWGDAACDKDEEALWNFHWRARFRLVNPEIFGAVVTGPIYVMWEGEMALKIAKQLGHDASHHHWSSLSPARAQYTIDYASATVPPMSLVLH